MTRLDQIIDALAARDPQYLPPDTDTRRLMQRVSDAVAARLDGPRARDLAREWIGRPSCP